MGYQGKITREMTETSDGYQWNEFLGLLELSLPELADWYEQVGKTTDLFRLYDDDSEGAVEDLGDLVNHIATGGRVGEDEGFKEGAYKTYEVKASSFTYYKHTVRVPAHISPDQIADYYRENGANGEFDETSTDWSWDGVEETDDDSEAETIREFNASEEGSQT